ncbi:hypothetical protein SDC9_143553 [bioreactor metagenome]|uniref:Uncharacterized protein n=1 Tax=bioreactor metagenome TaxID=1076179 RepID=A0A645E3Q1_9ZZZZ
MSSLARGNVNARAEMLVNDNISYSILRQMSINESGLTIGTKISANRIMYMRCDGVIEYCYEYYGFRVYGNDTYWDLSTFGLLTISHHSYNDINPETQATYYLTQVLDSDTEPT